MAIFKEPLSGGLNTAMEPGLLGPSELSHLQNYVYRSGSANLWYANGRQVFGTASATASEVDGLRDIHFDNGDHYLVAMVSGTNAKYRYVSVSGAATSGTFTDLSTLPVTASSLEAVHFRNRFFLLNGSSVQVSGVSAAASANSNVVAYLSATAAGSAPIARSHGLIPVSMPPSTAATAGTFSQTFVNSTYYEYWTTEVARITQDGAELVLESTWQSEQPPTTVFVTSQSMVPIIQMPTPVNPLATHWRIYRSPFKATEAEKKFPTGFRIGELAIVTGATATGQTSFLDTVTTSNTAAVLPASVNTAGFHSSWTNPTNLTSDNNSDATRAGLLGGLWLSQGVYNFNFGGFKGNIKGIIVTFEAFISAGTAPAPISVTIGSPRQADGDFAPINTGQIAGITFHTKKTASRGILVASTSRATYSLGSATDPWRTGANPFVDTDFSTNFMVTLSFEAVGKTVSVDWVAVQVYYAASVDSTEVFPTVAYTFGDIISQVGKHGPPPSCNTGDVYEDTLVVNDITNPSLVRYSSPGLPESFPATYFVDFETRENDRVTFIRTVNNRLVVGLDTSVWRMNYLPSERDASFDRGKAIEVISRSIGIINPMCACTFTMEGGQEHLAFVSQKGLHSTDGYSFTTRSGKLSWRGNAWTEGVLELTGCTPIALLNNPEEQELLFFYRNDSHGGDSYLCLHFSYAPGNILSDDSFKVSGPVHLRNYDAGGGGTFANLKSAWVVPRANGDTSIFLGYGGTSTTPGAGQVFIEASAAALPALTPSAAYSTRRLFLAGEGQEYKVNQLLEYMHSTTDSRIVNWVVDTVKTNQGGQFSQQAAKTVTFASGIHGTHYRVPISVGAEGMKITRTASESKGPEGIEYLLIDGDGFAEEDSGL